VESVSTGVAPRQTTGFKIARAGGTDRPEITVGGSRDRDAPSKNSSCAVQDILLRHIERTHLSARPLPGLESLPLLITSEGAAIVVEQLNYEKYRAEAARLERRIKSYNYKRRKPERLEQDRLARVLHRRSERSNARSSGDCGTCHSSGCDFG
jgi:hypothetical protein